MPPRGSEGGRAHGGLSARMRDGITRAVRSGGQLSGLGPSALVSFLAAAAFAPFLVPLVGHGIGGVAEGEIGAALSQLGAVGGGYFAELLTKAAERTRRRGVPVGGPVAEATIRDDLAAVIGEALDEPGAPGSGPRCRASFAGWPRSRRRWRLIAPSSWCRGSPNWASRWLSSGGCSKS